MKSDLRANLYSPMTFPESSFNDSPSAGALALEDRTALRRVAGLSTELADVSEVEYRQLRLERVVLVGVWTEGSVAEADASLAELAALAETAGSEVLEGLIRKGDFVQGQAMMAGVAQDGARTVSELQSTYILENG